ncbi:DUF2938 domain-containing protein [Pseudoalteromonas luteoviolacea]|uniref:DUF2938 domain-containing protein n=1 Tax=Pseudoalteromonas luteoviolacea H33 TaxID=1365251 RepID=A0A167B423_9GAMM|nr:DUF2938 domain-containing protein [Pseudoalteromonas luteoviolacea]KZN46136.1 hypothetical protein N476_03170 [Pseudoalteromonas luteoviolacea H33]KZN75209.1 hypothetical protein N477_20225 [Pseudoalteromonas luteoviolacea H33-S]
MYMGESALHLIGLSLFLGVGATLFMDIWSVFVKRVFNVQPLNYALVGRWLGHLLHGQLVHGSIVKAATKQHESVIGWAAHYVIGVFFAFIFILSSLWIHVSLLSSVGAIVFGALTVIFPYFIMQPCFGMGIAASKTPQPSSVRLKSLMAHVSFGVGLSLSLFFITVIYQ